MKLQMLIMLLIICMNTYVVLNNLLAYLSLRLIGELIVYQSMTRMSINCLSSIVMFSVLLINTRASVLENYFFKCCAQNVHPINHDVICPSWALTPLFGNGAVSHGIGKISGVSTKIGKIYIVYMYEVSIA